MSKFYLFIVELWGDRPIHTYDIVDPEILIEVMNKNIPLDIIAIKKIISQEEL